MQATVNGLKDSNEYTNIIITLRKGKDDILVNYVQRSVAKCNPRAVQKSVFKDLRVEWQYRNCFMTAYSSEEKCFIKGLHFSIAIFSISTREYIKSNTWVQTK